MLGGNRSESGIIIPYSASEHSYLVLALYEHALLLLYIRSARSDELNGRYCVRHRMRSHCTKCRPNCPRFYRIIPLFMALPIVGRIANWLVS